MRLRFPAQATLLTCCLLSATSSGAQQVRGSVIETGTRTPVVGAVISLLDSAGRNLGSVTSDTTGRYSMARSGGGVSVRVLRLGFRPGRATLPVDAERDIEINVEVERIAQMLSQVRVNGRALCPDAPNRRSTLDLWEQARAGLLAAVVARQTRQATVTAMNYARVLYPESRRVRQIETRSAKGASSRPFLAARSADAFERDGFAESRGGDRIWYAPDADVLLDDRFARSHCFSVRSADSDHPGQFGLTFAPIDADSRTRVDVAGTLWIDQARNALTRLEFEFTGPGTVVGNIRAGGEMDFVTVRNGATIITRWEMTFPGAARDPESKELRAAAHRFESGGFVVSADWPDGASWKTPLRPIGGRIVEEGTNRPLAGAIATLLGWSDSVTANDIGEFVLPTLPPGEYRLIATDTTLSRFLEPRREDRMVTAGTTRVDVTIPVTGATAELRNMCKGVALENSVVILGKLWRDRNVAGELSVNADWESRIKLDPDGRVSFEGNQRRQIVDKEDRFAVCGVEPGRAVQLDLYITSRPVTDTVVVVGQQERIHEFDWIILPTVLADAARGAATGITGTVVDNQSGAPIANAEIWVVTTGDQLRTDSSGHFEAKGLAAGRHMLQVRRLGYFVHRDTLTLRFGTTMTREYRMMSQAQMLDTITTVSSSVKYTSALLRDFENRRATGVGRYVSEAELRKVDGEIAGWLKVFQKIPGTRVVTGTSGEHVESTRGTGSINIKSRRKADPNDRRSPTGCWLSVYLDGVALNRENTQRAPDLRMFQTMQFAGVEYYASNAAMPAQFAGVRPNECGVLLLWTRER